MSGIILKGSAFLDGLVEFSDKIILFLMNVFLSLDKESIRNWETWQNLCRGHYILDTERSEEIFSS